MMEFDPKIVLALSTEDQQQFLERSRSGYKINFPVPIVPALFYKNLWVHQDNSDQECGIIFISVFLEFSPD